MQANGATMPENAPLTDRSACYCEFDMEGEGNGVQHWIHTYIEQCGEEVTEFPRKKGQNMVYFFSCGNADRS